MHKIREIQRSIRWKTGDGRGGGGTTTSDRFKRNYFEKEEKLGEIFENPADEGAGVVDIKFLFGR